MYFGDLCFRTSAEIVAQKCRSISQAHKQVLGKGIIELWECSTVGLQWESRWGKQLYWVSAYIFKVTLLSDLRLFKNPSQRREEEDLRVWFSSKERNNNFTLAKAILDNSTAPKKRGRKAKENTNEGLRFYPLIVWDRVELWPCKSLEIFFFKPTAVGIRGPK